MNEKLRELIVCYNEINKIENELCEEIAKETIKEIGDIDYDDVTEDTLVDTIRNNKNYKELKSISIFYGKEEWDEIYLSILTKIAILKAENPDGYKKNN